MMDSITKRIGQRDWNEIKSIWIEYISIYHFPIQKDDYDFFPEDVDDIGKEIKSITSSGSSQKAFFYKIDGIHYKTLIDSIILFYKGMNSLKSGNVDYTNGIISWSIANYYQSTYFFIKSLMNVLGIINIRTRENYDLLIDLFSDYKGFSKKEISEKKQNGEAMVLKAFQFEHWQNWEIVLRLNKIIRNLDISSITLTNNSKDYAKLRNKIIYYNNFWYYDDLYNEKISDKNNLDMIEDPMNIDFIINLSFRILEKLLSLFEDLAKGSNNFSIEYSRMQQSLISDNFELYNKLYASS